MNLRNIYKKQKIVERRNKKGKYDEKNDDLDGTFYHIADCKINALSRTLHVNKFLDY